MARKKTVTDTRAGERPGNRKRYEVEETEGDASNAPEFNVLKDGARYRGRFTSRQSAVEAAEEDSGDVRY